MASMPTEPRVKSHHGEPCWFVHWYDDAGKRRDKWFGKVASVQEREAKAKYLLWLKAWREHDRVKNPGGTLYTYTGEQLAVDYVAYARKTFVKHGRMTSHVWEVAYAMQAMADAFGEFALSDLGAPEIAGLRDAMIFGRGGVEDAPRCVKTVNGRLTIIKQSFGWARERGLVTKETAADVMLVRPLVAGRCDAKPSIPVRPVNEHWLAVTRDKCPSPIKAMIDVQWFTGMRPGEACMMRGVDIDRTGDNWQYAPSEHKLEHMERERVIPLGPECQKVIAPFLNRPPLAFLFSPQEAHAERLEAKRAVRKTPLYPSHAAKRKANPVKRFGTGYSEESYRKAIHHACDLAFPFPGHLPAKALAKLTTTELVKYMAERKAWRDEHRWNPNQLRHSAATAMNKQFPLEDVAQMLGHGDLATTRRYAEPDAEKANKIARKIG